MITNNSELISINWVHAFQLLRRMGPGLSLRKELITSPSTAVCASRLCSLSGERLSGNYRLLHFRGALIDPECRMSR